MTHVRHMSHKFFFHMPYNKFFVESITITATTKLPTNKIPPSKYCFLLTILLIPVFKKNTIAKASPTKLKITLRFISIEETVSPIEIRITAIINNAKFITTISFLL